MGRPSTDQIEDWMRELNVDPEEVYLQIEDAMCACDDRNGEPDWVEKLQKAADLIDRRIQIDSEICALLNQATGVE